MQYLTSSAVSEHLHISRQRVQQLVETGQLQPAARAVSASGSVVAMLFTEEQVKKLRRHSAAGWKPIQD